MKKHFQNLSVAKALSEKALNEASELYFVAVQAIASHYRVYIVTGQMSDIWQIGEKWGDFKMDDDKCSRAERNAFKALAKLDDMVEDLRIGPSNMERFNPLPEITT